MIFAAPPHDLLAPFTGGFPVDAASTRPPRDVPDKNHLKARLEELIEQLDELQRRFYAHDQRALLLIFQALDAAGTDSTLRAVMNGVDPAGCYVHGFKQPSALNFIVRSVGSGTYFVPTRNRLITAVATCAHTTSQPQAATGPGLPTGGRTAMPTISMFYGTAVPQTLL